MRARYDPFRLEVSPSYRELFDRDVKNVLEREDWRIVPLKRPTRRRVPGLAGCHRNWPISTTKLVRFGCAEHCTARSIVRLRRPPRNMVVSRRHCSRSSDIVQERWTAPRC